MRSTIDACTSPFLDDSIQAAEETRRRRQRELRKNSPPGQATVECSSRHKFDLFREEYRHRHYHGKDGMAHLRIRATILSDGRTSET